MPPPSALRAGDYLVVYQRRGVQYNATEKKLRWGDGASVAAEVLHVEPGFGAVPDPIDERGHLPDRLTLPWLLGMAALAATRGNARRASDVGEMAWIAGAGYLAGAFALTLWMRVLSFAGVRFGILTIAAPLAFATIALGYVAWRREGAALTAAARGALRSLVVSPGLAGRARGFWWLLVAWLALRFVLLGLAVTWQPLYPWTRGSSGRPRHAFGMSSAGSRRSRCPTPGSPRTARSTSMPRPTTRPRCRSSRSGPILRSAAGRCADELAVVADRGRADLGRLRRTLAARRIGAAASSARSSWPRCRLPTPHVALAGYADLRSPRITRSRHLPSCTGPRPAARATPLSRCCSPLPAPRSRSRRVLALTLVPGVLVTLMPRHGPKILAGGLVLATVLLVLFAQANVTIFNYRLHLDFDPAWWALGESYFLLGNWNLLWYAAFGLAVLAWRQLFTPALAR